MFRTQDLRRSLAHHLHDPENGWSIGCPGALAEFRWDASDLPFETDARDRLNLASTRGGLQIRLCDGVAPLAYETLSTDPDRWLQGIEFCLPEARARVPRRHVLTELGPDVDAIRTAERSDILFDLGLGLTQTLACIRTGDSGLLEVLRANCGRPIFGAESTALAAILADHPHRVFVSRLGRAEVYQRIGADQDGSGTPEGPHTHVLPDLLARGATQPTEIPLPHGLMPCLTLYPASPLVDQLGRPKPFDSGRHRVFQDLLGRWGDRAYLEAKAQAITALRAGLAPENFSPPGTVMARTALRIALRQMRRTRGPDPLNDAWRAAFDHHDSPGAEIQNLPVGPSQAAQKGSRSP